MNDLDRDPYISVMQAAELIGCTERSVYLKIEDGLYIVRPSAEIGANGKPSLLVQVGSLPPEAQFGYWQQTLPAPTVTPGPGAPDARALLAVSASARATALKRHAWLMDCEGLRSVALAAWAEARGLAASTVYGWRRAYQLHGQLGLVPKYGRTKGRFTALSPVLEDVIKAEYLSPKRPSPTTVYRRLEAFCQHVRQAVPSKTTVLRYLRTLPAPAVILSREGPDAWRAKSEPKIHRDFSDLAPNDVWCGDHRELDVFVRESDAPGATIFRPWLTAWLDLRTYTCVGRHVGVVPNSTTIALALRDGMLRYGVPVRVYQDNGKDYRCHYLNGKTTVSRDVKLSADAELLMKPGVLSALGIGAISATPYTPWAKPIESWFGRVFPEWEKQLPGWCGPSPAARPEKLAAELKSGTSLLTMAELSAKLDDYLDGLLDVPTAALDGATPRSQWQGVTKAVPDARSLDLLLMRHRAAKVFTQGLKLFGRYYWHDALAMEMGHTVDVRYDDNQLGLLYVFDTQGRFVCEAINQQAYTMHASHEDMRTLVVRKKTAKRAAKDYASHRYVLLNEERALADLAQQRETVQMKKVVNLDAVATERRFVSADRPTPVTPMAGGSVVAHPTTMDFAAAQLARGVRPSGQTIPSREHPSPATASRRRLAGRSSTAPAGSAGAGPSTRPPELTSPEPSVSSGEPSWDDLLQDRGSRPRPNAEADEKSRLMDELLRD